MKRITAIFSLIIMMVTAIQPIIAMHYCGDKLHSLHIYGGNELNGCCDIADNKDSPEIGKNCCKTELVKLYTDDYQNKAEQFITRITTLNIEVAGTVVTERINLPEPYLKTFLSSLKFPPKGLYLNDVGILTYICIYRI